MTNKTLTPEQLDEIYKQVKKGASVFDILKFRGFDQTNDPLVLTPGQKSAIDGYIKKLTPDYRDLLQGHYNSGLNEGRIVCPTCNK